MDDPDASSELAALRAQVASLTQQQELALSLGVAFWDWDVPSGAVRSVGGSLGLLGHEPAETPTTSRGWSDLVHPEDLPIANAAFEPCVTNGQEQWLCTLRLRRRVGTWQWMQVGGRVVERDQAGKPLKVLGIVQDHRARKLAEDAVLRDAELLSKVSASVICTDMDGVVTYWNPGAERLYGFTAKERVGRSIIEQYPLAERPLAERAYAAVLAGQAFEGEWHAFRKDGSRVWVEARVSMFRDAEGRPAGVIGISHDISERRRAEADRRVLEQQLFQAQKLETIGTLAGGIAHDFNNILTAILVHAELGMGGALTPSRVMESFGQIHQASVRAKDLVKRILTFTRPQQPERRLVSATQLLQEAAKFSRAIVPSTIELSVGIADDAGEIWVDTNQFHQVVLNLVTNAVQAMKNARGRLAFRLSRSSFSEGRRTTTGEIPPGAYLLLSVLDDGDGMAEEARRRAFEPFFTTKAPGEGTGLGLSIVQGIVQSHGGGIELTSAPGVGTTFHIYWPSSEQSGFASSEPPSSSSLRGRGQRVLVVDDEQAVAFATRLALENLGYVATYVTSPEAFFDELEKRSDYELALVDHTMPRQTGLDIAARLRAEGRELPVIIASGDARHPAAESLQQLGRAAALRKPYDLEQLAETVYRLLGKRRGD